MPPRTVKKSSAVAPPKKTIRAVRSTPKSQNQSEAPDESVKVEKSSVAVLEVKEEFKAEQISEEQLSDKAPAPGSEKETPKSGAEPQSETKPDVNGSATQEMETEVKEFVEEYEKDERLELEDNDAEYDPEEEGGVDYDEKEIEEGDVHEDGDEAEDDPDEENVGEEEEGDMAEEEMEDVPEELEGEEEEEEHAGEEHEGAQSIDIDEEEHHEVVKERRKRKEFEIFVGGLDKDATEDDLRKVFSQVGDVTEVRLMMNTLTKKNKGFAFLRYSTIEQAKRAVAELKNPVVKGKQCGVTPSQDSDTLFLGNICKTWTKEALKEKLKQYGIENVEDLTLVEDNNNEGMNRGFAFLEFSSRSDAMDAFKRLQKRDVAFGIDRPAKVSFADSFIDPGDEIMAQVKTVFVDGLLPSWDEDRVRDLLKKYGELEKVELARNMPSAKRKDFGFVTFDSHEAAVSCAKSINNSELGEGDNKAKVRARLSRPLQRGKGRPLTRPDFHYPRGGGRGGVRGPWARPPPRSYSGRGGRGFGPRFPPPHVKRMVGLRERRPAIVPPARARPLAHPSRSYERRPPVSSYPKSSLKREYGRREEFPSRRTALEYGSRAVPDRRMSYRDDYVGEPAYNELPRSAPRSAARRAYQDDGYGRRPPPAYREGRAHDYDSLSGSKRPYAALDDVPARYADPGVRPSRARIDYELGGGSHYADTYGDRYGRSNAGYGGGRTSLSTQDSHGLYGSRQGVNYGGSLGGSDAGRMYSSSYGGDYASRGSDVGGGSSYSSLYSNRGAGGSGYMGSGGSGSYY